MFITSNEHPEGKEIAVRGDVNADGRTDQIDLSYLIRYIIGISGHPLEGVYYEAGDFKKDGNVDQIDLTNIIRYIVYGKIDNETEVEPDKDTTPPEILETIYSEQDWTSKDVEITMKWQDAESGIVGYQIRLEPEVDENGWYAMELTKQPVDLHTTITENGTYYVFVKNADGTIQMKEIKVDNIDKTAPQVSLSQVPDTGKIQVEIVEEGSGITVRKYAKGNQDTTYFENNGTAFTGTEFEVTEDGTYTVYIQDRAGNKTVETISIVAEQLPTIPEPGEPEGGSTPIQKGDSTEVVLTPNKEVTINPEKFIPVNKDGEPMDATIEVSLGEDGKIHITVTGGNDEGEVYVKVLPGGLIDAEGRENEEFTIRTHVVIDNTKPSTEITQKPEEGTAIKEGDTLSITINPKEKVTVDTSKINVTGEGAEGADVQVQQNPDGTITIVVTAGSGEGEIQVEIEEGAITDGAGNTNPPTVIGGYRVDNTNPTITEFQVVPPTTTNSITVEVVAEDNHPEGLPTTGAYEYHISKNADFSDETVITENTGKKEFTDLEQSTTYYIKVIVKDRAGNVAESETITTATSGLPTGETAITFSDATWENEKASITISKKTEAQGYKVQYQIKDSTGAVLQDWIEMEGDSKVITDLVPGNMIIAQVVDESGNAGSTTTASIIDAVAPTITLAEQEKKTQGNVTITATIQENESGVAVRKYAKGTQKAEYFADNGTIFAGNTFEVAENGEWTVYVEDKAGNKTVETITVTKKDNEKPGIADVQLPPTSTTIREGTEVEIVLTPSEPDITVVEEKFVPVDGRGNTIDADITVTKEDDGTIHVKITAGTEDGEVGLKLEEGAIKDEAGNENEETTIPTNVTINNQKPSVNIVTPADNPIIKEGEKTTITIKPNTEGATIDLGKIVEEGDGIEGATIEKRKNPDGSITIIITGGRGTGDINLVVQPGAVTDPAGNTNDEITLPMAKIDNSGPTVTLAVTNVTSNSITVKATAVDVGAAGLATEETYTFKCSSDENFGEGGGAHNTGVATSTNPNQSFTGLFQGTYYLKVTAKDAKGNIGVSNIVVQETGKVPEGETNIQYGPVEWNNGKASTTIRKTESVPDEITLQYKIEKDGILIQDWQTAPQNVVTIPELESGTIITARLADTTGNYNGTKTLSIIDNTGPTITLAEQSAVTSGNVTVTATITDSESGVVKQKYALGNQTKDYFRENGTEFTGTTFEATENGVWTVYAEDAAGNSSVQTITVTKQDKTRPTISEVQVPTNTKTIKQGEKVQVVLTPSKEVTINKEKFIPVDETGKEVDATLKVTQNGDGTITVEITAGTEDGKLYLKVEEGALIDALGNKNEERTINVNTIVDNTKPVLTTEDSAELQVIAQDGTASITVLVSEEVTVDESKITINGEGSTGSNIMVNQEEGKLILTIIGGTGTGSVDIVLAEGAVVDTVGNKSEAKTITGAVAVDNEGPNIQAIEFMEKTTSTIKIRVNAVDVGLAGLAPEDTFTYRISKDPNFETSATYEVTYKENIVEFTGLQADTTYYIQVIAIDALGNSSTSETKNITTASLPTGENSITFSDVTWENRKGKVTIIKDTTEANDYMVQYKIVNADEVVVQDWTTVAEDTVEVSNVENGSTVYARLYDGTSGGGEKTKKVEDITPPTFPEKPKVTVGGLTGTGLSVEMHAIDENGLSETEPYSVCYKKTSEDTFTKIPFTEETKAFENLFEPGTEYVLYLEAKDYFGNIAVTEEKTFTTHSAVAQIGHIQYVTLQAAFNAVPAGSNKTIELLQDITENGKLVAGRTATLDLKGKTISGQIQIYGNLTIKNGEITEGSVAPLHVYEGGNCTLGQNLSVYSTGTYQVVANSGTLTVEGATLEGNATAIYTLSGATTHIKSGNIKTLGEGYGTVRNEGTLTVSGGRIYSQTNGSAISNSSECTITDGVIQTNEGTGIKNTGTLRMEGGAIDASGGANAINNENRATITGGTIAGSNTAVAIVNKKQLTIEGDTFSMTGGTNLVLTEAEGTTYLNSGTYYGTAQVEGAVAIYNSGTTQINGGTFTMDDNLMIANEKDLTITGGNFGGKAGNNTTMLYNSAAGVANISGGQLQPSGEGQALQNHGRINFSGTASIIGTYTLAYNYTETSRIDITGGSIQSTGTYDAIYNGGILNISGGTIRAAKTAINNAKTATISGGTIHSSEECAVYNAQGASVTITGGTIEGNGVDYATVLNKGTAQINGASVQIKTKYSVGLHNVEGGTATVTAGSIQATNGTAIYNLGTLTTKTNANILSQNEMAAANEGTWYIQNGTTITSNNTSNLYAVHNVAGVINMTGGTITSLGLPIGNKAEFNFSAGTIKATQVGQAINNLAGGTFTMTGGSLSALSTNNPLIGNSGTLNIQTNITHVGGIITNDDGGITNLISGTLTGSGEYSTVYNISGTIYVKGATVKSTTGHIAILNEAAGIVEASSGSISSSDIAVYNEGRFVTSGTIQISSSATAVVNKGTLQVNGGTITGSGSSNPTVYNDGGAVTVTAGTVSNTGGNYAVYSINGGTYNRTGGTVGNVGNA